MIMCQMSDVIMHESCVRRVLCIMCQILCQSVVLMCQKSDVSVRGVCDHVSEECCAHV